VDDIRFVLNICGTILLILLAVWIIGNIKIAISEKSGLKGFFKELNPVNAYKTMSVKSRIVVSIIVILGCISIYGNYFGGNTQIGSLWEKSDYRETYYVLLYPKDSSSKNYKVPARIWSHVESYETSYRDDVEVRFERIYNLEYVSFQNGGYLYFEDQEIELGEKCSVKDHTGERWEVELTNQKA